MPKIIYLVNDPNNLSERTQRRIAYWKERGCNVEIQAAERFLSGKSVTQVWLDEEPNG